MITRRTMLLGGALEIIFLHVPFSCACSDSHSSGCDISGVNLGSVLGNTSVKKLREQGQLLPSSGDKNLDRALAITLAKLVKIFGVLPSFVFADESIGDVAFASKSNELGRDDGVVVIGQGYLRKLKQQDSQTFDAILAAVCAHEFGHIAQWKYGVTEKLTKNSITVKPVELHADFLVGYFAGIRKLERSNFPAQLLALGQYKVGDIWSDSEQHHGTPEERGAAVVEGYKSSYISHHDFNTAFYRGMDYVIGIN